jgi:hypothetical protein
MSKSIGYCTCNVVSWTLFESVVHGSHWCSSQGVSSIVIETLNVVSIAQYGSQSTKDQNEQKLK